MKHQHRVDPNKPLLEMTKEELRDAFDECGLSTTFGILEESRAREQKVLFAAAILIRPDGTKRLAHFTCDYGDGEFAGQIREWVEEVYRTPGLLVGEEKLVFQTFDLTELVRPLIEKVT